MNDKFSYRWNEYKHNIFFTVNPSMIFYSLQGIDLRLVVSVPGCYFYYPSTLWRRVKKWLEFNEKFIRDKLLKNTNYQTTV